MMTSLRKREENPWINLTSALSEPGQPCQTVKAITIEQALDQGLPWPWEGKVLIGNLEDLTKDLFLRLKAYGLKRIWIQKMFGIKHDAAFYYRLKKIGVATRSEAAMAANVDIREKKIKAPIVPPQRKKNIPDTTDTSHHGDAESFTIEDDMPIPYAVAADFKNDIPENENDDSIDLAGWEIFSGSQRKESSDYLTVSKKIYVGRKIATIASWQHCSIAVRPDGEQIALKKSDKGVKVGNDSGRSCLVCKDAITRIKAIVGPVARYKLLREFPDLVVFILDKEAV